MSTLPTEQHWEENVILADADWMDRFVFELTVNFERMLERALPKAQLAQWMDYLALDGGLRPGNNKVQVLLIHSAGKKTLKNCIPSSLTDDLDGKAFSDNLGEFQFSAFPVETELVDKGQFFAESLKALAEAPSVKRLLVVPDVERYGQELKDTLRKAQDKNITLFATEPVANYHCKQEILTYSAMATLGIRGEELPL